MTPPRLNIFHQVVELGSKVRSVMEKLSQIKISQLPDFLKPVKNFIDSTVNLYEKVRKDVMTFYNVSCKRSLKCTTVYKVNAIRFSTMVLTKYLYNPFMSHNSSL